MGCILCTASLLFFYCLMDAIDREFYVHLEFFDFTAYSYVAGGILLLVFNILGFFVAVDLSICYDVPNLYDLRVWYAAEVAPVLGYEISH